MSAGLDAISLDAPIRTVDRRQAQVPDMAIFVAAL